MIGFLFVLLASPQDVDRLLAQEEVERALSVLQSDLPRMNQVQGRLVLQSFLAHKAYDGFWDALSLLRAHFSCPTCYADLGWTAAVREQNADRALEEVLRRIQEARDPRLVKTFVDQYLRVFHTTWDQVRPRAEVWASREKRVEAWKALAAVARLYDPLHAVRYALLGRDTKTARELLLEIPPSDSLFRLLPESLERDGVALRLGRLAFRDFLKEHAGTLRPEDWAFVMRYLPPDQAWSEELARVGEELGLEEALPHGVFAGTVTPARLDTLCGGKDLSEGLARSCGVAYLRANRPDKALESLRRVIMAHAGEEEALLWLWTLEYALGNRDGVSTLLRLLEESREVHCEDAVCTILQGTLLLPNSPEEGRKTLEALVLSDAPEPLKMLARHYLEYGPPSPEVFRSLREFLEALALPGS